MEGLVVRFLKNHFSMYAHLPKEIYVLAFGKIMTSMGALIWPMLTLIMSEKLNLNGQTIGMYMMMFSMFMGPFYLLGGKLADKYNKKHIIVTFDLIGNSLYFVCAALPISMTTLYLLAIASVFQSMEQPAYDALIADLTTYKDRERAYSLNYLAMNLGLVMAPMLGGMLFHGDDVFKKIGELSGGQKARLVLLKLVLDGANCLVLDEPTNHLDIMAREAVEAALEAFDGTVLVVSHDRYFVNEVADRIWEIEDLEVKDYKGNYDFYLEEKQKKAAALAQAQEEAEKAAAYAEAQAKKQQQQVAAAPAKAKKQEDKKRRYSPDEAARLLPKVELQIREQEAMMGLLEKQMADPANHTSPEHSAAMAAEHEEYEQTIAELMEKWELLMEAAEDA